MRDCYTLQLCDLPLRTPCLITEMVNYLPIFLGPACAGGGGGGGGGGQWWWWYFSSTEFKNVRENQFSGSGRTDRHTLTHTRTHARTQARARMHARTRARTHTHTHTRARAT